MSSKPTPSFWNLLGMGVTAAVCLGAGIGGGYWLDATLRTGILLTFLGLVVGMVAAVAAVYLEIRTFL